MSAGLPNSAQILVFGFLTANGQKMSKSLGNVVDPYILVDKYGADPVRYYLLAEIAPFEDGDYSENKFQLRYNADLANGLGNLVARVSNLLEKNQITTKLKINFQDSDIKETVKLLENKMIDYHFNEGLQIIWNKIRACDEILTKTAPWKLTDKVEITNILQPLAQDIVNIAYLLEPFLPNTSQKIQQQFLAPQVLKGEALFPRL